MLRTRFSRTALAVAVVALVVVAGTSGIAPARADVPVASYVVTFDGPPTAEQIDMLSGVAIAVHGFAHLPAAIAVALPADTTLLAGLPGVRGVFPNSSLTKLLRQSTRTIGADIAWSMGTTGEGIGIAVIDTGIDGAHPDLCAAAEFCRGTPVKTVQNVKFIGREDLGVDPILTLENQITTDTSSGHGTHVAAIAAGLGVASTNETGKYRGVAPGARLIGLGTGELLSVDNVLSAFDWVLENKDDPRYNIKVINNSWGPGAGTPFNPEDPVQRAISVAHDAGLSVVFGAGNEGPTTDTLNAFSINPDAISVAGGEKNGHAAFFSSRGVPGSALWRPTVAAPGYLIASARASTGFLTDVSDVLAPNTSDPILPPDTAYYATGNGTSMSSPHVAGVVALIQQAAHDARAVYLTPDQVKNVLQNTAVSRDPTRGPGGLPNYQDYTTGAGYVDAAAAVRAAAAGTATAPYNDHVTYNVQPFSGEIGPAALIPTQSFASAVRVAAGSISLDVMADWGVKANDVDIDLYDPSGNFVRGTALVCDPPGQPNGYSSFCTNIPNERITIVAPAPGEWRAVIHGTLSATDTVHGMWSVAYPDGLAPAAPSPASVEISPASTTSVAGQSVALVATVRDASGTPLPNAPVTWATSGARRVEFGEAVTDSAGTAAASVRSDVSGTQTVTATTGGLAATASVSWLGVTVEPEPSTPGRASGGGWILDPAKRTFGLWAEYGAGSSGPGGELSYDDHQGTKVKATAIRRITISGARATITGTATLNGAANYDFQIDATDNGSPGRNDTFHLVVTTVTNPLFRYETSGNLGGGNLTVTSS